MANIAANDENKLVVSLMQEADGLREQAKAVMARMRDENRAVNSAAARLAETQSILNASDGELNGFKADLDRTQTKLISLVKKRTACEAAPQPGNAAATLEASTPDSDTRPLKKLRLVGSKSPVRTDSKNKDRKVSSPVGTARTKVYEPIHPTFPTVMFIQGHWSDVRCGVCGANAKPGSHAFFKSRRGFARHLSEKHGIKGLGANGLLDSLKHRVVGLREVAALKNGEQPSTRNIKRYYGQVDGRVDEGDYMPMRAAPVRNP